MKHRSISQAKGKVARCSIFIVDDHPMTRFGLKKLIQSQDTLLLAGESDNAEDTLEKVQKEPPDLLLVDLTLRGRSGLELIKDLRRLLPEIEVLVFSMHEESYYAERVLRAGGRGYVMKSQGAEFLLEAIETIRSGKVYVSNAVKNRFLDNMSGRQDKMSASPVKHLTDRELEVLALVGKAFESVDIAGELNMSVKTVEAHRSSIRQKLNIRTRAELVRFAVLWLTEANS
ncbi:response regulator transcription factor [Verrucomicrobia bacterium]|nr:response regulator transcription factor [Verrucomicrobiota bacterium]